MLSKLDEIIEATSGSLKESSRLLAEQRKLIDRLHAELTELMKKRDKIAELDKIKMKFKRLRIERYWALVIEKEGEVNQKSLVVAQLEKELEVISEKLTDSRDKLSGLNEDALAREQAEVRKRLAEKKKELDSFKLSLNDTKRKFNALNLRLKGIISTIAAKESQIRKLSTNLERRKAEQAAKAAEQTDENQKKLESLERKKKHLESSCNSIRMDVDNFKHASDQQQEKLQQVANAERQLRVKIESINRNIQSLKSSAANKYSVFGTKMQQLVTKVDANIHKFRKRPRGPLGALFRVKDSRYLTLVEGILWNHLHTFVVDNARDLQTLKELMHSVYNDRDRFSSQSQRPIRFPTIVKMDFAEQMYDISRYTASHESAPTLLEVIEADKNDHIVMNALIEVAEIERILLFKDSTSACQLLKNQNICPRTVKAAYTLDFYRIMPAPRFAARVEKVKTSAEILKSGRGREAAVAAMKAEIETLKVKVKDLEPEKLSYQEEERNLRSLCEQKQNEFDIVKRDLMGTINELKRHTDHMKQQRKQGDLNCFYEELDELTEDKERQVAERETTTNELQELHPQIIAGDEKRNGLDREFEELNTKYTQFEESREQLTTRKAEIENIMRKMQAKLTTLQAKKDDASKVQEAAEKELQEKISNAEKCGRRIETTRTSAQLLEEFNMLKVHIQETEARLGDIEEIQRQITEITKKYREHCNEYRPLKKLQDTLEGVNEIQGRCLESTKSQMCRTLTLFFATMVKQRGFEGSLLVDHKTHELYYFVCPDGNSASKTVVAINEQMSNSQNTSRSQTEEEKKMNRKLRKALIEYSLGLSGGERSFATICFIMALWQVMECPFYMLDEFDVFMDAFNRKTSQAALYAHAKKFKTSQFVLFTPLDLTEVPKKEEASVFRLFPPVRNESTANQPHSSRKAASKSGGRRKVRRAVPEGNGENVDPLCEFSSPSKSNSNQGRRIVGSILRELVG